MRTLRREDGFALVLALACIVVFGIATAAAISYTTSNQQASVQSGNDLQARQYAEAGLNDAYSTLVHANSAGSDPTTAGLLGTSASPLVFCITTTSCNAGDKGSATVMGCYGGTNGATCTGISPSSATSTWVIVSTGYAAGPLGTVISRTTEATVQVTPLSSGAVAAVWNHIFLTAPLVPNTCQTTFAGNTLNITAPIYTVGNLCLTGNTDKIMESGQPVDVMVGGKLAFWGNTDSVGQDSTHPITSAVVVGGCTKTNNSWTTSPCGNGTFNYWVHNTDTYIAEDAPTLSDTEITNDYNNFDPGPKHPCASGNNPYAPLAASVFDNNTTYDDSAGTFQLTPASNYACVSQGGASTGQLVWNNTNHTLIVNGNIFIDGNLNVTQSLTYTGVGLIMVAGTITFQNQVNLCAVSSCSLTNWQGTSGNNQMLSLDALAANNPSAISVPMNSTSYQGALFTQPSSGITIAGNTVNLQGPMSLGTIVITGNTPNLEPLPVIKNMPVGAPVPPNTSVSIGQMSYIK